MGGAAFLFVMAGQDVTGKSAAKSKKTAKPRGKPWPKGVSGNPAGAPKRGESWAEIIKRFGEMTPSEAAQVSLELSKKLMTIGDGVTLKQAVVLRVYSSLLFEPQPGLLNAFMERAEGKVTQPVSVDWRQDAKARGVDPDRLVEQFVAAMITESPDGNGSTA